MNKDADHWLAENSDEHRTQPAGGRWSYLFTCSTFVQDVLSAGDITMGSRDTIPCTMIWNLELLHILDHSASHISWDPVRDHAEDPDLKWRN